MKRLDDIDYMDLSSICDLGVQNWGLKMGIVSKAGAGQAIFAQLVGFDGCLIGIFDFTPSGVL